MLGDSVNFPELQSLCGVGEGERPDLVVLLPGADVEDLEPILAEHQCWLVPVLVFGERNHPRADYYNERLSAESYTEGFLRAEAIYQAIKQLPASSESSDIELMSVLALAHTRQSAINATWQPTCSGLIGYPLLAGMEKPIEKLESLADLELLIRQPFERLHVCNSCGSSRLHVREECPSCHSSHIVEAALVHHYPCGNLMPETEFLQDRRLICPKCHKELRHYGVDYDKPETQHVCRACGDFTPDPDVGFICLDCHQHTPGDVIDTVSRYHYRLGDAGYQALMSGILPNASITDYVEVLHTYCTLKEFTAMTTFQQKVARRYSRDISGCVIQLANLEALKAEYGVQFIARSFVLLSEIISQNLRETDLLTSKDQDIYMLLTETAPQNATTLMERLNSEVESALKLPLALTLDVFGLGELEDFKDKLLEGSGKASALG